MDQATRKLAALLRDSELAAVLAASGFRLPGKIRDAKDGDLDKVIGRARRQKLRLRLPKRGA